VNKYHNPFLVNRRHQEFGKRVLYAARLHRAQKRPGVFRYTILGRTRREGFAVHAIYGYLDSADREQGIKDLMKQGFNSFTRYNDYRGRYAVAAMILERK